MSSFSDLTAVARDDTDTFSLEVDPSSFIARGPNGGYIAAVLLRALLMRVGDIDSGTGPRAPRSLTIHYPAPPVVGPAVITTEVIRAGRSLVTCAARLTQQGKPMATALAAFSPAWPGEAWNDRPAPKAASAESLPHGGLDRPPLPFLDYWDHRFTKGHVADPAGPAETEGWIRLAEPETIDGPVVAAMTDAFPPAVFTRLAAANPVPTVDLTIHFRTGLPMPGLEPEDFVLGRFRTRTVADGFLEEDGELWTGDGTLVAQSRQLAIMLPG
jgi:acyl-coenzyme A thioesterase PaaI-like protein